MRLLPWLFGLAAVAALALLALPSLRTRRAEPAADLRGANRELHERVIGALRECGIGPDQLASQRTQDWRRRHLLWTEREVEVSPLRKIPPEELDRALARALAAGRARHEVRRVAGGQLIEVRTVAAGQGRGLLVERILVRDLPRKPPAARLPAPPPGPRAALVIDDLGRTPLQLRRLAGLGIPLSVAVLPRLEHSAATAREAQRLRFEVLLHLPMEPLEERAKDPGPGVLLSSMSPHVIRSVLREDLASVPGAAGVNNHMGSRFTADARALEPLMVELRALDLYFLDSRTTARTLALATAQRQGVPAAQRTVFLDDAEDPLQIRLQVGKLLRLARERGAAIGIGHPHAATLGVLEEMRDELRDSGIEWVPVSALVRPPLPAADASGGPSPAPRDGWQAAARH